MKRRYVAVRELGILRANLARRLEKWGFAPNLGLVKVAPLACGDHFAECQGLDPKLTMARVQ